MTLPGGSGTPQRRPSTKARPAVAACRSDLVEVVLGDMDEVVRCGLRVMLAPYRQRVTVRDEGAVAVESDIVLWDPFAEGCSSVGSPYPRRPDPASLLVFYTWQAVDPSQVTPTLGPVRGGLRGWLTMRLSAAELVSALERVHRGEVVFEGLRPSHAPPASRADTAALTAREREILELVVEGLSNRQIVERTLLSINSVKTYIRCAYRKIGATSRSEAVLWGVAHGLRGVPDGSLDVRDLTEDLTHRRVGTTTIGRP